MSDWSTIKAPLLFAHRGASAECVENTLPAYHSAQKRGADVLELDVHATADGRFAVLHDDSGLRMAGVDKKISRCTLAEVQSWKLGGDQAPTGPPIRVPSLEEVLDEFPGMLLNIDVKEAGPQELAGLLRLLEQRNAEQRVLLTSFSWSIVRRIRALGYRGLIGMSRTEVAQLALLPASLNSMIGVKGARVQVPVSHPLRNFGSRDFIDRCHDFGLPVDFWVVNQPEEAEQLLEMGANGIVTDDPRAIAEVFKRSRRGSAWRKRHPELLDAG